MSRSLTGRIVANPSGTFTASLPKALGSVKRHEGTSATRAAAERRLRSCVVAREAGLPLPAAPKLGRGKATPAAPRGTSFKQVGEAFVRERYVEDGHGDVDRDKQVRGYVKVIDKYMRDRNLTVRDRPRPLPLDPAPSGPCRLLRSHPTDVPGPVGVTGSLSPRRAGRTRARRRPPSP